MNRLVSLKTLLAATVAFGALAAASAAHARTDVYLSLGVPAPVYVEPQPVYVQPQPVYVQPQPVYVQPQSFYVQPSGYYVQPQTVYYGGYGHRHGHHRRGPWGDADRDGVPNRYDRAPGNPYRH
jgi:hypothetical protein